MKYKARLVVNLTVLTGLLFLSTQAVAQSDLARHLLGFLVVGFSLGYLYASLFPSHDGAPAHWSDLEKGVEHEVHSVFFDDQETHQTRYALIEVGGNPRDLRVFEIESMFSPSESLPSQFTLVVLDDTAELTLEQKRRRVVAVMSKEAKSARLATQRVLEVS
jgi:hypothetical protein